MKEGGGGQETEANWGKGQKGRVGDIRFKKIRKSERGEAWKREKAIDEGDEKRERRGNMRR